MDAIEFADLPPNQFAEAWARLSSRDQAKLAQELSVLAQRVVFAARYADMRDCGESHKNAMTAAAKSLIRLRRDLSYIYPEAIC